MQGGAGRTMVRLATRESDGSGRADPETGGAGADSATAAKRAARPKNHDKNRTIK